MRHQSDQLLSAQNKIELHGIPKIDHNEYFAVRSCCSGYGRRQVVGKRGGDGWLSFLGRADTPGASASNTIKAQSFTFTLIFLAIVLVLPYPSKDGRTYNFKLKSSAGEIPSRDAAWPVAMVDRHLQHRLGGSAMTRCWISDSGPNANWENFTRLFLQLFSGGFFRYKAKLCLSDDDKG